MVLLFGSNSGVFFKEGVHFENTKGHKHEGAVLKYDSVSTVLGVGPLRVLFSRTFQATVLPLISPLKLMLSIAITTITFVALSIELYYAEKHAALASAADNTTTPKDFFPGRDAFTLGGLTYLLGYVNAFMSFLLGLYVSSAVSRWWNIRLNCVGGLWGAIDDLMIYAAAWWSSGSEADSAARKLVLRYGTLSFALFFAQARGLLREAEDADAAGLGELIERQMITRSEAAVLAPLPSKPQVVWAWMAAFWTRALSVPAAEPDGPSKARPTAVPHGPYMMHSVMEKIVAGRGSIGAGMAHVDTQQPFAYVHMLGLMSWVTLIINALYAGLKIAYNDPKGPGGWPTAHGWPQVVGCGFVVIVLPIVHDSLLGIGSILDNPLGFDQNDFPAQAFEFYMHEESSAYCRGVDGVRQEDWWEGTGLAFDAQPLAQAVVQPVTRPVVQPMMQPVNRQSTHMASV